MMIDIIQESQHSRQITRITSRASQSADHETDDAQRSRNVNQQEDTSDKDWYDSDHTKKITLLFRALDGADDASDSRAENAPLEIDLNLDRRKRRKTKPLAAQKPQDDASRTFDNLSRPLDQAWRQQLENAANDVPLDSPELSTPGFESDPRIVSSPSWPTATRSVRPNHRTVSTEATTGAIETKDNATDGSVETSPSLNVVGGPIGKEATPKKKLLKLNSNGKLLSSPISPRTPSKRSKKPGGRKENDVLVGQSRVVMRYGTDKQSRSQIGSRISELLSGSQAVRQISLRIQKAAPKSLHPFFLGELASTRESSLAVSTNDYSAKEQESENEMTSTPGSKQPVAWKDSVFPSSQTIFTRFPNALDTMWPPQGFVHQNPCEGHRPNTCSSSVGHLVLSSKSKERPSRIFAEENVINGASNPTCKLSHVAYVCIAYWKAVSHRNAANARVQQPPKRLVGSGHQVQEALDQRLCSVSGLPVSDRSPHTAVDRLRSRMRKSPTAFDLGQAEGPLPWTQRYAPTCAEEVLQPQAVILRDWLKKHVVTGVEMKASSDVPRRRENKLELALRQRRRRKQTDELDDFVVSSGDEHEASEPCRMENVILIRGPLGCGKTAAVVAVAKELDYEVFEIHPGMRRSAKDIYDKVGNMTQNHLVQQANNAASAPSPSSNEKLLSNHDGYTAKDQKRLSHSHSAKHKKMTKGEASKAPVDNVDKKTAKRSKSHKQSLILFEEVDILFDDDKAFWSGVVALISQSKRPIILTCNDESSIPFSDLALHTTLSFGAPPADLVSDYLLALAACEGHVLNREAVSILYQSKDYDLRAAINELDFWCQMGVGSRRAGLDWMTDRSQPESTDKDEEDERLRVFSENTYVAGSSWTLQAQVSGGFGRDEEPMRYAREFLGIPISHWLEDIIVPDAAESMPYQNNVSQRLCKLQQATDLANLRSEFDLLGDYKNAATFAAAIGGAFMPTQPMIDSDRITLAYVMKPVQSALSRDMLMTALEPITVEKPTFPPALGRLAPSFDGLVSIISADVAPYVRCIVSFDQRLERLREELGGVPEGKKIRKTRAARAALEGGTKITTRREKWFPNELNFAKVMETGGKGWQTLQETETRSGQGSIGIDGGDDDGERVSDFSMVGA